MMGALPKDLDRLIRDAVSQARASGLDSTGAARRAAQAVRAARPDLTPDEAWSLVELSGPPHARGRAAVTP